MFLKLLIEKKNYTESVSDWEATLLCPTSQDGAGCAAAAAAATLHLTRSYT